MLFFWLHWQGPSWIDAVSAAPRVQQGGEIPWSSETFPAVGRCHARGDESHAAPFTDEHIIPFGLLPKSGDWFLPMQAALHVPTLPRNSRILAYAACLAHSGRSSTS